MKTQENRKQRIAVLFGGQSTEHEVSLCSSINVISAIDHSKYDITLIGIDKLGRWTLCNEHNYLFNKDDLTSICLAPPECYLAAVPGQSKIQFINVANGQPLPLIDVAFSVLHGNGGENGSVQNILNILKIPYAGSSVLSSAICMDKDITKKLLRNVGIPVTPSYTLLRSCKIAPDLDTIIEQLGLPLFIKPASQGSSIGTSKVTNYYSFAKALSLAFNYDSKILVEQWVIGREIEIAILGNDSPDVSVCGEIITDNEVYSYKKKYLNNTQVKIITPAKLPVSINNSLRETALKVYSVLGCSVMARVDFFLTKQGQILVNEVNTLPGFTSRSMYTKLWEASGLGYHKLIERLIMLALCTQH